MTSTITRWLTTRAYLFLFLCYLLGHLAWWKFDSYIPFKVIGPAEYTTTYPGASTTIIVPVERDFTKPCSVLFSRYLHDSAGTYYDLMATRFISAKGIFDLGQMNPGEVKFSVKIPPEAAPGPAVVVTQLAYMCNPVQNIWPMDYDMRTPITIGKAP